MLSIIIKKIKLKKFEFIKILLLTACKLINLFVI